MKDAPSLSLPFLENLSPQAKRERPRARAALPARYGTARVSHDLEADDEWTAAPGSTAPPVPRAAETTPPSPISAPPSAPPERAVRPAPRAALEATAVPRHEATGPFAPPRSALHTAREPRDFSSAPRIRPFTAPQAPVPAPSRAVASPARAVEALPPAQHTFELDLPEPITEPLRPEAVAQRNLDSSSSEATVVHVTIDRIDLRADPPPAPTKRTRPEPSSSLGDYLKQRAGARRGRPAS